MITPKQLKELKKYLKRGYAEEVGAILQERGIKNLKGNDFDYRTISAVFTGSRSNQDIENAIFELYRRKQEIITERDQLLKIKKPEVAASGIL